MEWMIKHKPTARTERLVHQLMELAREIDDSSIVSASPAARVEWIVVREKWPSMADVRAGVVYLSDEALELMLAKVRRFQMILHQEPRLERLLATA